LTVSLGEKQRLLPVVDKRGALVGVLTRGDLQKSLETRRVAGEAKQLREIVSTAAVVADADEPLRVVVNRMAKKGVTRMPVVERGSGKFLGLISLDDLLKARTRHLEEEHRREQTLWLPYFGPTRAESAKADS
jgi:CBS domain-containing protein